MMNMMKRILSLTLAFLLVVSYIPMPGHAEENEGAGGEAPQTCTQCGGELHGEGEVCPKQPCSEAGCYVTGVHENHEFCQVAGCDNIATAGHTEHTYCDEAECKLRTTEAHTQHKYCEESGCYAIGAHENHEFCQVAGCDNIATAGHTEHTYCDEAECRLRTSGAHTQHKYCSNDACTVAEPHTEGEGCFIPCDQDENCALPMDHEGGCRLDCTCPIAGGEHVEGCTKGLYTAPVCNGAEGCTLETGVHETDCTKVVAGIGENGYTSLDDAIAAANGMTGNVIVDIYGAAEYGASTPNLTGAYDNISFVGKKSGAKITITRTGSGGYISGGTAGNDCNVSFSNLILDKVSPSFAGDAGFMNCFFTVYRVGNVSYTNCTFPCGACAQSANGGKVTYTGCTFYNSKDQNQGKYSLWVYANVDCEVVNCTFADNRGIKMYTEGQQTNNKVTVRGTDFSAVTAKPAIVLTDGEKVTISDNKYPAKGVFELEMNGSSNGTTVDADIQDIPCWSEEQADCGVLVDGKIYRTIDDAIDDNAITEDSTVTLMYPVTEEVTLPAGSKVQTNGYTANIKGATLLAAGKFEGGHLNLEDPDEYFITTEIKGLCANESVVVEIYSGTTKVATTTLKKSELFKSQILSVKTCLTGDSSSWDTVWEKGHPRGDFVPDSGKLIVDGQAMNSAAIKMRDTDDNALVWADLGCVNVAQVGENDYTSLKAAVDAAAANGGTVTVLADHTAEAVTIPADKTVTIDLNSKTVKIPQILNKGALTVQNGTVEGTDPNKDTIRSEAGSLTLTNVKANGQRHVLRIVNGIATINGGEYTAQTAITGTRHALNVGDDESASNVAVVTVKGGKFVGPNGTTADSGAAVMVQKGSTVIIDGGDFSKGKNNVVSKDEGATLTITGGTFDQSVKNYIPATHKETEKDGIYTVAEKEKVASIGTKEYYTLQDAVDDAKAGDTIIVLCDVDLTAPVVTDKKLMLNLNGKTIRNTADIWNTANKDWSLISVQGGQLTITGNGKLIAKDNDCYAVDVRNGAQCVIQNGTFVGNISAVYVLKGNVYINGGEFSAVQKSEHDDYRFLLNLSDENRLDSKVVVQGGTFVGFNPENNLAEGENTNFCADGFKAKEVETGKWQVVEKDYVVQVGTGETAKTYESLAEAIADIEPSETATTITVLKDFEVDKDTGVTEIPAGKNIVINLNGKTVTMPGILNKGTLEVKGGTIVGNNPNSSVVENYSRGTESVATLTVNFHAESLRHGIRADGGVVNVLGGIYNVKALGTNDTYGINASDGAKVTIADGTVINGPAGASTPTNIAGAAVTARGEGTVVTIKGGTYGKGQNDTISANNKAKIIIEGGIFTSTNNSAVGVGENAVVSISGGTFTGGAGKALTVDEKGSLTITAGTFDEDPSDYIDESKYCVGETAGVYTVAEHEMTDVPGVPAQCERDGYEAHKMCTNCRKLYVEDEDGNLVEKQASELTIEKLGHSFEDEDAKVAYKAPTYTEDGNKEYYVCDNDCGKYFLKTAENTYEEANYNTDIKLPKLVSEDASGNPTVTPDVSDQIQGSDSDLVINLTDKDFVGTGNTDTDTVKILDEVLEELNGSLTVITYAGEVTFNKEAVAAMADAVTCEGVTIEVSSHDESVLNANQKSVLSAKNLKNKSKIIRVEVRDCAGNLLGGSTTANKGYGFGTNGKITIEVKKTISSGTKTSDYHAYWITDTKLVEESLAFATVGSDTYARITVTHLSDYVIGRAAKFTWSPATGDTSNIGLWIGVLGVSVVALGAVAIVVLKKKKK